MGLSAEVDAAAVSAVPTLPILVEFHFVSEVVRVWNGFGTFRALDAREWRGAGEFLSVSGLSPSLSASAPAGTIELSGVSAEAIARAAQATEYKGRPLNIYLQALQGLTPDGNPAPLAMRFMRNLRIVRNASTRKIIVSHEGPYTGRRQPAAAWYTHADQDKRHPGDTFCDLTTRYRWKRDEFPVYE